MDKNFLSNEEDSLVEIEIEEQEEIEVEESETEPENIISCEKPKNNQLELANQKKINIDNIYEEKEEMGVEESKNKDIDKDYSEIEFKIIDIMNGKNKIINLLNNNKWEEKKEGFFLLNEFFLSSLNKDKIINNFEIFFNYIQSILKNFKESNYIILKEGLECIYSLLRIIKNNKSEYLINKKYIKILITELYEKIIENKLKNIYIKLINIAMNFYNPNEIINFLIQIIIKSNKISLLKEYSLFLKNYLNSNENNIKLLNIKDIIDFSIKIGNNNSQELRKLSTDIILFLYNYIDDEYMLYIKNNIKKSIYLTIEQKIKQNNKEKNLKSKVNSLNIGLNEKINNNEIPFDNKNNNAIKKEIICKKRIDISKYITPLLLKYINLGKWNEKKEAIDYIHKILNENNNYILINGLQDLINLVTEKLIDSNKNLVKLIIDLLSHLIESLGEQLKPFTINIITNLLSNLSDKNNILRNECVTCINKWISFNQNFEIVFTLIPSFLLNDNFEMRNEILNILIININIIKKYNYYINHCSDIINSLLYCLQDKSSYIRNNTEQFIKLTINLIPREK